MEELRGRGWRVGGIVTPEVREGGTRAGFDVIDLMTGRRGRLSNTGQSNGPRVGKYFVDLGVMEAIGVVAIMDAMAGADLVVIDEIGPMEMKCLPFSTAVREALGKAANLLAVVHWTMAGNLRKESARLVEVNPENRDGIAPAIVGLFLGGLV